MIVENMEMYSECEFILKNFGINYQTTSQWGIYPICCGIKNRQMS